MSEVVLDRVAARPTAIVAAHTTWRAFPREWPVMSAEVWTCLRASGISRGCPNIMLYRDAGAEVDVEVGVELRQECELTGRVVSSTLPAGTVARITHRGSYSQLGIAHEAIARWCDDFGYTPTGTRWEIYGPHSDDPAQVTTEIYWLLVPDSTR